MEITAIMSIYNGEKYIDASIGSLLQQTSPHWKLICIDDGSTDNSLVLLQKYAKLDKRIIVLHQENRGLSIARATAFSYATTEYVSILDCDDAYAPDYIEKLLYKASQSNADAIISDVMYGYSGTPSAPNHFTQHNLNENSTITDGIDALRLTIPWRIHGWFCIKRSIVQKYYTIELASSCSCKHYFDEFLARLMYFHCQTFAFCNTCYLYRTEEGSITRSLSINKIDLLTSLDSLLDLCIREKLPDDILINIYNEYYCQIVNLWRLSKKLPTNDIKKGQKIIYKMYRSFCKKISHKVLRNAPIRTRLKLFFATHSFYFIRIIAH